MKLICLVAPSASGKDFVFNIALKMIKNLQPIISHTSRPMRSGEQDGIQYHFVSLTEVTDMLNNNEFIEKRIYNVACGESWVYGIHKSAIDVNSNNNYIAIVDLNGLKKLEKYLYELNKQDCLYSIYLDTKAQLRLQRSLSREGEMNDLQVQEVLRRFEDDKLFVEPAKEYCDICMSNNTFEEAMDIVMTIGKIVNGNINKIEEQEI